MQKKIKRIKKIYKPIYAIFVDKKIYSLLSSWKDCFKKIK